ncbi:hypothetical protein A3F37_01815 [Candidatus Saccharibacteria bacterium RIFCSPHIGHO2_12_FULL_41_12]|nr:MAG: hypothetical protein A3F37_01815 [Candidatus Saccharibacteria bacterium RIFCSPHIGHO2_12_FULL_41_12]
MTLSRRVYGFLIIVLTCLGLAFVVASAQEQNSGSGLQISPTRSEVTASPGEQKTISIILKNVTQGDVLAKVSLNDFESDNVSGTPQIIVDTKKRTPYTINSMLKDMRDVELKKGETKEVKLTIDVPSNAAPGAYFGAIRYAANPKGATELPEGQRQVALTASVAHLVFVEVPGDITQQIQIESLDIHKDNKKSSFFFKAPNKSSIKIKNKGNGFSRPFGQVSIKSPFGKEVYSYEVNNFDPRRTILPNSSRVFIDDIKNVKIPGKYKVIGSVAYGDGGEVINYETSFWYVPTWLFILIIALIAGIVGLSYYIYRKRLSYKKKR